MKLSSFEMALSHKSDIQNRSVYELSVCFGHVMVFWKFYKLNDASRQSNKRRGRECEKTVMQLCCWHTMFGHDYKDVKDYKVYNTKYVKSFEITFMVI